MPTLALRLLHKPPCQCLFVHILLLGKIRQTAQIVLLRHTVHFRVAPVRIFREDLSGNVGGVQQGVHIHGAQQSQRAEEGRKLLCQRLRFTRCTELLTA